MSYILPPWRTLSSANGTIAYIDCLFLCYSASTVTGLSTINLSTCTGFQQALLFIQMILGNVVRVLALICPICVVLKRWTLKTTVSWIMVLIRKQYFKQHCETVMREYREKHRIRGVWNSIAKRSFRRDVSGPKVEEEPISPDEPVVSADGGIVAALAAGAGVGLGVGMGHGAIQGAVVNERLIPNPLEAESLLVGNHTSQGIAADAHSFTSSPRSIVSNPPAFPPPEHGNPGVRWDEQSFQGRTDRNYMRKRTSRSSSQSVRGCTDDYPSPSVHDGDTEYLGFGAPEAERPRHGRISGTN